MFTVLNKLKYRIKKEVQRIEELYDANPSNELYNAEIYGLNLALDHVLRAEAEEYTELDKWAEEYQKGKEQDELTTRNRARG
jgi:hypothetical protein|tara:strand:+ start:4617 stop:4862 length:246 start_codon:yes stop_codon:yes gene_type:complete